MTGTPRYGARPGEPPGTFAPMAVRPSSMTAISTARPWTGEAAVRSLSGLL
jgi:hypothetical protein